MTAPPKPTLAQVKRRQAKVADLWNAGCTAQQIARALDIGLTLAHADLRVMTPHLRNRSVRRYKSTVPDPEPYDWISEPELEIGAGYQLSGPLPLAQSLLKNLRETNARNRLAHNVIEAEEAGDQAWFLQAQLTLGDLAEYIASLQEIMTEPQQRVAAATSPLARDKMTPRPSTTSTWVSLPVPGKGQRPGRVHLALMAELWAHGTVTEDAVGRIAGSQQQSPARVRRALKELQDMGWKP